MTPFATFCLFVVLFLACVVVAKAIDWPKAQIVTRKPKIWPEDIRISPELLESYREELYRNRPVTVHTAMKQKVKASPQKGNFQ